MIEFNQNNTMKVKDYYIDFLIENNEYWLIILIIYYKYIFYTNNKKNL